MRALKPNRQGVVLIAVLVAMGVAMTILLGSVAASLKMRRDLRQHIQVEQTRWLLDLGVRHAISSVTGSPDYAGEDLDVSLAIDKYSGASVEISILEKTASEVRIGVTAVLERRGLAKSSATRRSEVVTVDVASSQENVP